MTTKPARSKCSTRRFATIPAMISSAFVNALAALEAQSERERVGEIARISGRELVDEIGHAAENSGAMGT